jgi:broad specificity phosphatase PhoE
VLFSSTESKALATSEALEIGLEVMAADELREVGKPWFDDEADLHRAAAAYLGGEVLLGWELLAAAVARFCRVIDQLDSQRDAVVVTHGMVMTAWLAAIGLVADGYRFWLRLTQPDAWEVSLMIGGCGTFCEAWRFCASERFRRSRPPRRAALSAE